MECFVNTVKAVFASAFVTDGEVKGQARLLFFSEECGRVSLHEVILPRGCITTRIEQLVHARVSRGKAEDPQRKSFDCLPYTEDIACRIAIDSSLGVEVVSYTVALCASDEDVEDKGTRLRVLVEKSPDALPTWCAFINHRIGKGTTDFSAIAARVNARLVGQVGSIQRRLHERVVAAISASQDPASLSTLELVHNALRETRDAVPSRQSESASASNALHRMLYERARRRSTGAFIDEERDAAHAKEFARRSRGHVGDGLSLVHMAAVYSDVTVLHALIDAGHDVSRLSHGVKAIDLASSEYVRDVLRAALEAQAERGSALGLAHRLHTALTVTAK